MPDLTSIEIVVNGANELTARSERIASLEDELTRTKRALEIAMAGLKEIAFNEDPDAHWSFNLAACRLVLAKKELGE